MSTSSKSSRRLQLRPTTAHRIPGPKATAAQELRFINAPTLPAIRQATPTEEKQMAAADRRLARSLGLKELPLKRIKGITGTLSPTATMTPNQRRKFLNICDWERRSARSNIRFPDRNGEPWPR